MMSKITKTQDWTANGRVTQLTTKVDRNGVTANLQISAEPAGDFLDALGSLNQPVYQSTKSWTWDELDALAAGGQDGMGSLTEDAGMSADDVVAAWASSERPNAEIHFADAQ